MKAKWTVEPGTAVPHEVADSVWVRAYRPPDEAAVLWLRRYGHLHGDAGADGPTVLRATAGVGRPTPHCVWVAEYDGRLVGATAVSRRQEQVAHLLWLCAAPGWQTEESLTRRLAEAATAHVREEGCLKLVAHTSLPPSQVARFFHDLGFEFSRERGDGGAHVLEFYLNLYVRPHSRESRLLWAPHVGAPAALEMKHPIVPCTPGESPLRGPPSRSSMVQVQNTFGRD